MKTILLAAAFVLLVSSAVRADAPGPVIGIGIELKSDAGRAVVAQLVPGSPAEQAGIKTGDQVVQVDGKNVVGMSLLKIVHLLHGARDSAVNVTVNRGGGTKDFEMKREILFLTGAPQPNP
jgi:carboxyl-terminal processing protease